MKLVLLSTSSSRNAGGLYNSVRSLGQEIFIQNLYQPIILAFEDEFTELDRAAYLHLPLSLYQIIGSPGIAFSLNLYKKLNIIKPDIIHLQGIYLFSSFVNLKYSKKNKIPYLISPRGMLDGWILNRNWFKKKIGFFLYETANIKNADCLHALCEPEYQAIRKYGAKNPIAIVPNGVFLPQKKPKLHKMPSWKTDDRKVLLFLSRLHPKKGIENLINAWAAFTEQHSSWKLVIAGETPDKDYTAELKLLPQKLNISEEVIFVGPKFHDEKNETFFNADAFILPSFSEGMPMAILEAWSYRLPVIMTPACNLNEGFDCGAAIKILPELESIIEGLSFFFSLNDEELKSMGNKGYQLVEQKFTWNEIATQMANLYDWIKDRSLPVPSFVRLT